MNDYAPLVRESLELDFPPVSERDEIIRSLAQPEVFNLVHIITGMRRSGKTFYLFQKIKQLLEAGVARDRIFYFNFSDDRLKPIAATLASDIVETYYRLVPQARTSGAYFFFDEVQELPDWQGFCQRLAEHEKITLTITGSSSKLSSEEIATQFRGRSHAHELLPLSFKEFCRFNGEEIPTHAGDRDASFSQRSATRLSASYDTFLIKGGFPGVQKLVDEDRIEILQSYVRDVVARDVADRFGKNDISLAHQFALFALRNSACELSLNNLAKTLQDAGYTVYWEKLNQLSTLFQQAYLYFPLNEYTTSLKPNSTAVPKAYAIDQGICHAVSRANQQDVGKRLETAVYLELRRRAAGSRLETLTSYTSRSGKKEKVDFLKGDALADAPYALYQVCADMSNEKTRQREIGSLSLAMTETGTPEGLILTLHESGEEHSDAGVIHILPAWQWSLL
ncbi:MAG: ATP-binding protein [Raoultibacter sp.]